MPVATTHGMGNCRAITALVIALTAGASTPALAQAPGDHVAALPPASPQDARATTESRRVSPAAAFGLALLGTSAGTWAGIELAKRDAHALGALAYSIGPSVGHLALGEYKAELLPATLRLGGLWLMAWGFGPESDCYENCDGPRAPGLSLIGAMVVIGATAYSVFAPASTGEPKTNTRRRRSTTVSPVFVRGPGGTRSLGLSVRAGF